MSALTTTPKFLYPCSRQFPFDEIAEKIVKAIEKRNWKVPGIMVKFDTYGTGESKYQYVSYIIGDNFKLEFGRSYGSFSFSYRDDGTAELKTAYIPKQCLEVFNNESGPLYYLYVGGDWEKDKHQFMTSTKFRAKMNHEPRTYLRYIGDRRVHNTRATELVANNDCGRDYDPEGNEPIRRNLDQTFKTFVSWLEESVLKYVLTFPEADTIEPPPKEELIQYDGPWPSVFSICDCDMATRIKTGKVDPNELPPEERYISTGCSQELVKSLVECKGRFSKTAYKYFGLCDANQNINQNSTENDFLPEIRRLLAPKYSSYIVAIKLKYANHVYVADNAKYIEILNEVCKARKERFGGIVSREMLSYKEFADALATLGETCIPINEYKGGCIEPIIFIDRELEFDEIYWVDRICSI